METEEFKNLEIPAGESKEDVRVRKQIILDFYRAWKQDNPTQRKYNIWLKEYVNVRNKTKSHLTK